MITKLSKFLVLLNATHNIHFVHSLCDVVLLYCCSS